MTNEREVLKLALVELENIYSGFWSSPRAQYTAIAAIKEALAQPEQEPVAWMHKIDCCPDDRIYFNAYYKRTPGYCIPLHTAPPKRQPKPEQEPVAWHGVGGHPKSATTLREHG